MSMIGYGSGYSVLEEDQERYLSEIRCRKFYEDKEKSKLTVRELLDLKRKTLAGLFNF